MPATTPLIYDTIRTPRGRGKATLGCLRPSFEILGAMAGFDAVALQKFHWVVRIDHVHHAGTSSGIVDGAALVLVGSEEIGRELELATHDRIVATAVFGDDPTIMLTRPAPASRKAMAKAVIGSIADANVGSILGIGFPGWTGGVLQYIDGYDGGIVGFVDRARELTTKYGARFTPPEFLVELAESGVSLTSAYGDSASRS